MRDSRDYSIEKTKTKKKTRDLQTEIKKKEKADKKENKRRLEGKSGSGKSRLRRSWEEGKNGELKARQTSEKTKRVKERKNSSIKGLLLLVTIAF